MKSVLKLTACTLLATLVFACKPNKKDLNYFDERGLDEVFGDNLKLNNPYTYSYNMPAYVSANSHFVNNDNATIAALGRVLFYDKKLSLSQTTACATCHNQANAFGAENRGAKGETGNTLRQPMRLVNLVHNPSNFFFWDGRQRNPTAAMTEPIKNHLEMGFSGQHNQPTIEALLTKLNNTKYYKHLTRLAFNDNLLTEKRIGEALAAFILSINSFDSKYDLERKTKSSETAFSSFTSQENQGKSLFFKNPIVYDNSRNGGGLGCFSCHSEGESFVSSNLYENNQVGNNGIVKNLEGKEDINVNKAPSIRNLFNNNNQVNGFFMSNGSTNDPMEMLEHYNTLHLNNNSNIDRRFFRDGIQIVKLNITESEKTSLIAFLKTLTGNDLYTNPKWSNPFLK